MIKVAKPADEPAILRERRPGLDEACYLALANGEAPSFDSSAYGHGSVKQVLVASQHGKCCYCEARVAPVSHGDIEHFRPKGAIRQSEAEPESRPGYYWLAYTWTNLFLACQLCNQTHKRSFFPLADPNRRVRSHLQAHRLADESPLLLDPARDDPERSITFRREVPVALDLRGETTIRYLGLANAALCENRADHLARVQEMLDIIEIAERQQLYADFAQRALTNLARMSSDQGIYTSMVRAHLRTRLGAEVTFPITAENLRILLRRREESVPPST